MAFDFTGFYYNIFLNRIVSAAVILLVGLIMGKVFGVLTRRILHEIDFNRMTGKIIRLNTEKALSRLVSYAIYLTTIIAVLNKLEIAGYIWRGFLIFIIMIMVFDLLLHFFELTPNIFGFFRIKKQIMKGDTLITELAEGKVKRITPLTTKIITTKGDEIYIPNSTLLSNISVKKKAI